MEGVMTEIEIKAHIPSIQPYFERAARIPGAATPKYVLKKDVYYLHDQLGPEQSEFRLRIENGSTAIVTRKQKHLDGDMEVNREIEFHVSDPEAFDQYVQSMGFRIRVEKEKKGFTIRVGEHELIELVEVSGLGSFAELEILSPSSDPQEIAKARKRLYELLDALHISEENLENRYYTDMLTSST
jgi:predicted adenylyl cyclase CyaB